MLIMKKIMLGKLAALLLVSGCAYHSENYFEEGGRYWRIDERAVPVPEDISIGLPDYITSSPQPDVKAASQFKPETGAEWKEKKNSVNSKRIVKTQELMKQLPVNITLSQINGVTVRYVTPP